MIFEALFRQCAKSQCFETALQTNRISLVHVLYDCRIPGAKKGLFKGEALRLLRTN